MRPTGDCVLVRAHAQRLPKMTTLYDTHDTYGLRPQCRKAGNSGLGGLHSCDVECGRPLHDTLLLRARPRGYADCPRGQHNHPNGRSTLGHDHLVGPVQSGRHEHGHLVQEAVGEPFEYRQLLQPVVQNLAIEVFLGSETEGGLGLGVVSNDLQQPASPEPQDLRWSLCAHRPVPGVRYSDQTVDSEVRVLRDVTEFVLLATTSLYDNRSFGHNASPICGIIFLHNHISLFEVEHIKGGLCLLEKICRAPLKKLQRG
mmetsp:Transcript_60921/g.140807  ORF Transcript_60921/g.140807 Transcript_60921/m.140807 type:complete len:257 (-) Transcript_60921:2154-2924(-)